MKNPKEIKDDYDKKESELNAYKKVELLDYCLRLQDEVKRLKEGAEDAD